MKKWLSIGLCFLMMMLALQRSIIIAHFKLNQEFIESNYCINRSKPQLECHGQCQLEKKLENTTENPSVQELSIYENIVFLPQYAVLWSLKYLDTSDVSHCIYFERLKIQHYIQDPLHPPTLC